jgi:hypothetical protein
MQKRWTSAIPSRHGGRSADEAASEPASSGSLATTVAGIVDAAALAELDGVPVGSPESSDAASSSAGGALALGADVATER